MKDYVKYPKIGVAAISLFVVSLALTLKTGFKPENIFLYGIQVGSIGGLIEKTFITNWQIGFLFLILIVFGIGMMNGEGYNEIEL